MPHPRILAAAGIAAVSLSVGAMAQFGPPPAGSAHGTESGTYGSSIGYDVRGTGPVDRYGRPYDPMNPTDTGRKPVDPREKRDTERDRVPAPGTQGAIDGRTTAVPGASMNPNLTPGATPGGQPGVSPNLNPGLGAGTGGATPGARGSGPGGQGSPAGR